MIQQTTTNCNDLQAPDMDQARIGCGVVKLVWIIAYEYMEMWYDCQWDSYMYLPAPNDEILNNCKSSYNIQQWANPHTQSLLHYKMWYNTKWKPTPPRLKLKQKTINNKRRHESRPKPCIVFAFTQAKAII